MKHQKLLLLCVALTALLAVLVLAACGEGSTLGGACQHTYIGATCDAPESCTKCGVRVGYALGHDMQGATCDVAGFCARCGAQGEALGHSYKEATCTEPATCIRCGYQHGTAAGHNYKKPTCTDPWVCTGCGVTFGEAKGHEWKDATCTAPKTCTVCGLKEGSKLEHTWGSGSATCSSRATCTVCGAWGDYGDHSYTGATCTAAGKCMYCGKTSGSALGHNYKNGACSRCGKSDPDYIPTYSAGQTWKVSGQWELSFPSAVQTVVKNGKQTVEVTWKYKNTGYSGKLDIGMTDFVVYDSQSEKCARTFYDVDCVDYYGADCISGTQATCKMGWVLNNSSSSIKIYVELKDSNGQVRKAWFKVNVTKKQQSSTDELDGCTIKVDGSLPKIVSYYTYSGSLQSSCKIESVTFKVSGDDLYIYFTGVKTYDSRGSGQSDSCKISWKLYDSTNYVVASGTAYTENIALNEGFRNEQDTAYNCITPGGSYVLKILNTN